MRELKNSDTTKDLSSSERSFGIEKGRRADIVYQPEYYERNLISSIASDVYLFMVI